MNQFVNQSVINFSRAISAKPEAWQTHQYHYSDIGFVRARLEATIPPCEIETLSRRKTCGRLLNIRITCPCCNVFITINPSFIIVNLGYTVVYKVSYF